jgi:hypothetical protein
LEKAPFQATAQVGQQRNSCPAKTLLPQQLCSHAPNTLIHLQPHLTAKPHKANVHHHVGTSKRTCRRKHNSFPTCINPIQEGTRWVARMTQACPHTYNKVKHKGKSTKGFGTTPSNSVPHQLLTNKQHSRTATLVITTGTIMTATLSLLE